MRILVLILAFTFYLPQVRAHESEPRSSTPLCDMLLAAAEQSNPVPRIELQVIREDQSTAVFAYLGFQNGEAGHPAGGLEYQLTGEANEILRIVQFYIREEGNNQNVGQTILARVLSLNPQVRIVREAWSAKSFAEWLRSFPRKVSPREAVASATRTKIYAEQGFKMNDDFNFYFDPYSTQVVHVDFYRQLPRKQL